MVEVASISQQIWDMKYRLKGVDGRPVDKTISDTWRRVARAPGTTGKRRRRVGGALLLHPRGVPLPAGGPHRLGGRRRAQRDTLQLLRHGRYPRRHVGNFRRSQGSGADNAAGRRHRLRFFYPQAQGGGGSRRRCRRLGSAAVHGRMGRHVPHHHERGCAARRHDGGDALRPSGHRGLRRGQEGTGTAAHVQPLGPGDRRLHAGGEGGRSLGADLRRSRLQEPAGAGSLGQDHAGDLRLRRARGDLHRRHQPPRQPLLLRAHPRHESVWRTAAAPLRCLSPGLREPDPTGHGSLHRSRPGWTWRRWPTW